MWWSPWRNHSSTRGWPLVRSMQSLCRVSQQVPSLRQVSLSIADWLSSRLAVSRSGVARNTLMWKLAHLQSRRGCLVSRLRLHLSILNLRIESLTSCRWFEPLCIVHQRASQPQVAHSLLPTPVEIPRQIKVRGFSLAVSFPLWANQQKKTYNELANLPVCFSLDFTRFSLRQQSVQVQRASCIDGGSIFTHSLLIFRSSKHQIIALIKT